MEIITIFIQSTGRSVPHLAQTIAALCLVALAWQFIHVSLRKLQPTLQVLKGLSLPQVSIGALSALVSPGAPNIVRAESASLDPSRSDPALHERVPPPRSLVRVGSLPVGVHPAVHRGPTTVGKKGKPEPLFPRAHSEPRSITQLEPWERGAADLRRRRTTVRSKGLSVAGSFSHHTVLPGDTLWDIAAAVLGTDDPVRIARYWAKIHLENRDVIGPDPDLLRPGQVLILPARDQS